MTALHRLLCTVLAVILLIIGAGLGLRHYSAARYRAGYDAAVALGREQRDHEAALARERETALRDQLRTKDEQAHRKEQEYATNLEAAQRRVRAGTDRLRCPARPVPAGAPAGNRPAASGPAADGEGPAIVPEVAAEILGDAADVGRILRNYQRVVERFEACRAVNAK
ncbi:hypothetical protein LE190_16240 [Massilia oculi]|uniref:Lysis protein n=1 Tax=Massilia hydrophila TaxID=3044279 RepID=A0ABS7YFZ9_9BURK|nr:hypothetical protein [Massilia oculi]MCA1857464.1 hypothetical protein [Massilia oculi]